MAGEYGSSRRLSPRARLVALVEGIEPWDDLEHAHQKVVSDWLTSGAPIYRTAKPDVPDMHLVSYFVVLDESRLELLLVAHRKAGLWLPTGGHVEPDEDPWETVVRECREELDVSATPSRISGDKPFFLTVTRTCGPGTHTDVSLWYVVGLARSSVNSFDRDEFDDIRWVGVEQVAHESPDTLDPHMHRFAAKLLASAHLTSA
jgi:8-oxo-dGTP pyrophosphatase MutT (NUDIX family)